MVRNEDNWCTLLWFVLCVLAFVLAVLLFVAIFGRLRLSCLKRRITAMVEGKNWQELYAAKTSVREYGMWKNTAKGILATSRAKVKAESCALGISLQYAFEELEQVTGPGHPGSLMPKSMFNVLLPAVGARPISVFSASPQPCGGHGGDFDGGGSGGGGLHCCPCNPLWNCFLLPLSHLRQICVSALLFRILYGMSPAGLEWY